VKIIAIIVALIFFLGGIYLFALAFQVPGLESLIFIAGVLSVSIALAIPVHVLKRIDA
jgi:hypothetical protein